MLQPSALHPTPKLLAKLTAVEVEAAAASGPAGRRRFDPVRPRGAVRDGRARRLRLAARRAASVPGGNLGGGAGLGDTPSVAFPFARPPFRRANPSPARPQVFEQFPRPGIRQL